MTDDPARDYLAHLRSEGRSDNTLAAYGRDLARYGQFLQAHGVSSPADATAMLLGRFPEWLRDEAGYADRSAARIVAAVRGLHRWLGDGDDLGPAGGLRVAEERPPAPVLSVRAMADLVEVDGVSDLAVRDRALLELLYATGARSTEAAALRIGDVDLQEAVAHLPGDRGRQAPLGAAAVRALQAWLEGARRRLAGDHRVLLTNMAGERLTRQGVWQIVATRGAEVGLDVNPGMIRASSRQHLLDGGMAPALVRRLFRGQAFLDDELRQAWDAAHPRGGHVDEAG